MQFEERVSGSIKDVASDVNCGGRPYQHLASKGKAGD